MAFYHCLKQGLQQRGRLVMLLVNYSDFSKTLVRENDAVFQTSVSMPSFLASAKTPLNQPTLDVSLVKINF